MSLNHVKFLLYCNDKPLLFALVLVLSEGIFLLSILLWELLKTI
jgi:hypothetical protein